MLSDAEISAFAQLEIDRHGRDAADHAIDMMMDFVRKHDRDQASRWLQIAYAIETLAELEAAGATH